MFHVGQEVVCVDAGINFDDDVCENNAELVEGNVYTISAIMDDWEFPNETVVRLREVEDHEFYCQVCGYYHNEWHQSRRFRPIVKTDISIFTSMLAPTPSKITETVE